MVVERVAADSDEREALSFACSEYVTLTTHSMDVEQRLVDVPVRVDAADRVTLTMPTSANLAPPGWYLLFVVTADGLPSDAAWVRLA